MYGGNYGYWFKYDTSGFCLRDWTLIKAALETKVAAMEEAMPMINPAPGAEAAWKRDIEDMKTIIATINDGCLAEDEEDDS